MPGYISIEDLIFCVKCGSKDIEVGKYRGFEMSLLFMFEENTCNKCGTNFDCDMGMVAISGSDFDSSYIDYASIPHGHEKSIKIDDHDFFDKLIDV
jgi:hypothetical protein